MTAKTLVLTGYGLNSEEETLHGFKTAGLDGDFCHINDLIENPNILNDIQILAIPGGFSYGDDTGSGNAFAQKMKLALMDQIKEFVTRDTLTIGICNGCQVLVNLGLAPAFGGAYGERTVTATYNMSDRYQCRWVNIKANAKNNSPWLTGASQLHIPVAHGEGRFMMSDKTLKTLQANNQIALSYVHADGSPANGEFPINPNGSVADIAGITDESGRVLALMPHPERGMFNWQRDDFAELKDATQREGRTLPDHADGLALFENAAEYFGVKKSEKAA